MAVVVDIAGAVVIVTTGVLTVLGVGGSTSGAKVSLLDEPNEAHELSARRETMNKRFIVSRL
jgi:hypothetical protein